MNEQEKINKEIRLTFDFLEYIIDNPKLLEKIPDSAEINFLGEDLPFASESEVDLTLPKVHFNCRRIFEPVEPFVQ